MQKALSIMQFKAEGRMIERRPEWNLSHRRLLHRIQWEGTGASRRAVSITLDTPEGLQTYPMLDGFLPTIDPDDPYAYSPEEQVCMDRLTTSFQRSMKLREHMEWMVNCGSMWTRRDDVLFYHACVPVDAKGEPLALTIDGAPRSGRELFDTLGSVVRRCMRNRFDAAAAGSHDADWVWYLWGGPVSPLFGKDKLATFETSFLADKETHKEHKNPYFDLMHNADFIKKVGGMFGCGDDVLVVNGHVPVKVEKGEQPIKRGGNAITIDGAFSEAYGDRGYTLVLRPDRIDLAEHTPFPGVEDAIHEGADIVPTMTTVRTYAKPRTIDDTQDGAAIRRRITDLELLVNAYQEGLVRERD